MPRTRVSTRGVGSDDPARRTLDHPPDGPITRSARDGLIPLATALAWGAGLIHAAVIVDHFNEYWLFGAFFAVACCTQVLWGVWAYRDPSRRRLLVGAIGNCAIAVVWAVSRTSGLPFGPERWQPESVGAADVLATLDELAVAVIVVVILRARAGGRAPLTSSRLRLVSVTVGFLLTASVLGLMPGGHHHA